MIKQDKIKKDYIKTLLPENAIIIEAGAHIGRDTVKMSKLWPAGKIYAFEPVPELFAELEKRAQTQNNIFCFNVALGKKNECRSFYVSSGRSTAVSSFFEPGQMLTTENTFTKILVPVVNLDDWAKNNNVDHVDFMWLDMQGAELEVLESCPKILSTTKILLIEVNVSEKYKDITLYDETVDRIKKLGFEPLIEDAQRHEKVNILFKRI